MGTALITRRGGSGAGLNMKVVGGTTRPTSPSENTIWVNTGTAITDWIFSATQPAAVSGRVWIQTGLISGATFNAVKKNNLQVYPLHAFQCVSNAWVARTTESYIGGKWVRWIQYLYNHGDEYTDETGGWAAYAYGRGDLSIDEKQAPTVTKSDEYVTLELQGQYWDGSRNVRLSGGYFTKKPIEMTGLKTLKINITRYDAGEFLAKGGISFGVTKTLESSMMPSAVVKITKAGKYTLDVSAVTAPCYVFVHIANPTDKNAVISFDEVTKE